MGLYGGGFPPAVIWQSEFAEEYGYQQDQRYVEGGRSAHEANPQINRVNVNRKGDVLRPARLPSLDRRWLRFVMRCAPQMI